LAGPRPGPRQVGQPSGARTFAKPRDLGCGCGRPRSAVRLVARVRARP